MICVVTMGLIYRQQDGVGKIGWESFLIIMFSWQVIMCCI